MSAPLPHAETRVLDGKYALGREIGRGGSGTVFEAEHLVVGKRVAVKLLHAGAADDPTTRTRFVTEARAAARIAHANVVDIHDLGIAPDGVPYLVMELLEGQTLAQAVASAPMAFARAIEIVLQLLAGLGAAHRRGLIHCDLKPASVMLTFPRPDQPLVKVLDFGIARSLSEAPDSRQSPAGTPLYLAPEQVSGEPVDERTDVYAAAAILYKLVTGVDPFSGKSHGQLMDQVARGDLRAAHLQNADVPQGLSELIARGMARRRRDRLGSAEEFSEQLRTFLTTYVPSVPSSLRQGLRNTALPATRRKPDASKPPESSVMRIDVAPRLLTDSLLVSPRLPKAPAPPKLEAGRDFLPMLGDPERTEPESQPTEVPRVKRSRLDPRPAILAMAIGFGAGILIAWAAGLI